MLHESRWHSGLTVVECRRRSHLLLMLWHPYTLRSCVGAAKSCSKRWQAWIAHIALLLLLLLLRCREDARDVVNTGWVTWHMRVEARRWRCCGPVRGLKELARVRRLHLYGVLWMRLLAWDLHLR